MSIVRSFSGLVPGPGGEEGFGLERIVVVVGMSIGTELFGWDDKDVGGPPLVWEALSDWELTSSDPGWYEAEEKEDWEGE